MCATFEHFLCLHSLQRSIYLPVPYMSDTLMDFRVRVVERPLGSAILKFASGSLADIHPGPPFARKKFKKECVCKIYLIHIHISSSLTLESISGLECVHGVYFLNAKKIFHV